MPVNSEIFRIYRHLFYGSPQNKQPLQLKIAKILRQSSISYVWINENSS